MRWLLISPLTFLVCFRRDIARTVEIRTKTIELEPRIAQVDTRRPRIVQEAPANPRRSHRDTGRAQVAQEAPIPPLEWQPIHPLVFEHPKHYKMPWLPIVSLTFLLFF